MKPDSKKRKSNPAKQKKTQVHTLHMWICIF